MNMGGMLHFKIKEYVSKREPVVRKKTLELVGDDAEFVSMLYSKLDSGNFGSDEVGALQMVLEKHSILIARLVNHSSPVSCDDQWHSLKIKIFQHGELVGEY